MMSATRIAASSLGLYAGLLGIEHGYFETLQGSIATSRPLINAIGYPCQADRAWHSCFPALTVVPNYFETGILAIIVGLLVSVWATAFIQRKHGGLIMILLSLMLLLVGGGFVSTYTGVVAGVIGRQIDAPLTGWWGRPNKLIDFLARLWPWPLVALLLWFPASWILGYFFNQSLLRLSLFLFLFIDIGLPLLIMYTGHAHDSRNTIRNIIPEE